MPHNVIWPQTAHWNGQPRKNTPCMSQAYFSPVASFSMRPETSLEIDPLTRKRPQNLLALGFWDEPTCGWMVHRVPEMPSTVDVLRTSRFRRAQASGLYLLVWDPFYRRSEPFPFKGKLQKWRSFQGTLPSKLINFRFRDVR